MTRMANHLGVEARLYPHGRLKPKKQRFPTPLFRSSIWIGEPMSTPLMSELQREACRIEEDSLFSTKGHFEAARAWGTLHLWLGIPAAVLAANASGSAFAENVLIAGSLALFASVLSAISAFLNPSERSQFHHHAGAKFNSLRKRARMLREIDLKSQTEQTELLNSIKKMAEERDSLNMSSPQIPRFAFKRARSAIESKEAVYEIDSNSDESLPSKDK